MGRFRILTWHVHGSYLYYLSSIEHDIYLPVKPGRPESYGGRGGPFPWGDNVHEVPVEDVRGLELDCVIYQSRKNYIEDQYECLSDEQLRLPRIYLEHDPPRQSPTETRHIVDDPEVLLVHVTPFNRLMWDSGRTPTMVIDHGVKVPEGVRYTGEVPRGIAVVNGLPKRGRRLGADVFQDARDRVPVDLVGIDSEALGGLGEVPLMELPGFESRYRFFFNPIRYTSLGLAVCEAMMVGMPVVGLATTEMASVVENGVSGYVDTDVERLVPRMEELLREPGVAGRLGDGARRYAMERFGIERFKRDWERALVEVAGRRTFAGKEVEVGTGLFQ